MIGSPADVPIRPAFPPWIGRYRLVGAIGSGGMASVYLGKIEGFDGFSRLVAVKVLHSHLAEQPDLLRQFSTCLLYTSPSPRDS